MVRNQEEVCRLSMISATEAHTVNRAMKISSLWRTPPCSVTCRATTIITLLMRVVSHRSCNLWMWATTSALTGTKTQLRSIIRSMALKWSFEITSTVLLWKILAFHPLIIILKKIANLLCPCTKFLKKLYLRLIIIVLRIGRTLWPLLMVNAICRAAQVLF